MSAAHRLAADADEYTVHREPREEGGQRWNRCRDCDRELLVRFGGFDALEHADSCRYAAAGRR